MGSTKDVLHNRINPTLFLNVYFHRKQRRLSLYALNFENIWFPKSTVQSSQEVSTKFENKHSYTQILNHYLNFFFFFLSLN